MDVRVVAAAPSDHEVLRNLLQLYVHDFSAMLTLEVEDDGRFAVPPLDPYWQDAQRSPFLIRVDGRLAGFALVHRGSRLSDAVDVWDMAEFFVLRRYRRAGVGAQAARQLFASHAGAWEVRERRENVEATAFWRAVIGAFTGGRFRETVIDDARWRGPVQSFESA